MLLRIKSCIYSRVGLNYKEFYFNKPIKEDSRTSYSNFISSLKRK